MIRLRPIGAAAFALALLALPTFAVPHKDPNLLTHRDTRTQLQDVNLADVVSTAQAAAGDGPDGLPTGWCGDETGADNAPVTPATKAQFKVVYAYAADRPDRFAGWKDAIQANVAIVQRFLSAQDGGTKGLRFDMGTGCGPQFVDIQTVQLPGSRASYADNFSAISGAVQRALGAAAGPRNAIVIADGLSGSTQEYGLGETVMGPTGERQGAANIHNRGGLTSILFSRDGAAAPGSARWGWWPEGFLHEMTHNLGAVQWGAPHSTQPAGGSSPQYGHCWQGADVMCYVEDGGAAHPMQQDCAGLPGAIPQNYDCGHDDYFNPAPAPGSYLATHWNTYDSAFLAGCGEVAPACGGGSLWVPEPPAATTAPSVAGTTRRGQTLTARVGVWTNSPTAYTYQWQRLIASGWEDIDSATGASYVVSSEDLGRRLRVAVVASNEDGSASAASAPSSTVGASGLNRAATSTSKKGKRAAVKAKASKKRKAAAAKRKAAAKRRAAAKKKPKTVRH
ncbi:hypothetical protein OM076_38265 [Solirubrobacter ginsenosidimutans]|uniref:Fibronectin type-III domain-containing protein n=1 Tax=Solirubrobacter ginsenosidimutans TaxID=490573 RepID=A0A9X3N337_9ACTN|nr:hypothetical protein [Solirubrobacter ginsenosidimutans]MDA0166173.1 hypothetical protein [Solirubrobacter ginsenosidimutans]